MKNMRKAFRALLADDNIYAAPGIFEGFGAMAVREIGFPVAYVTGNGVSASLIGMPDYDLLSMREVVDAHRRLADIMDIPLIGDADTGYGGVLNVYRAIREFEQAGIAAVHMEDQVSPKRCAYYKAEMELVEIDEFQAKIRAAVAAKDDPDFTLIARTDAYRPFGLDETVRRCAAYAEAGADAVYVVGATDLGHLRRIADAVAVPLVANCNDGDGLALVPLPRLREAGVKMLLYPAILRSAFIKGAETVLTALRDTGGTQGVLSCLAGIKDLNRLNRFSQYQDLERSIKDVRSGG